MVPLKPEPSSARRWFTRRRGVRCSKAEFILRGLRVSAWTIRFPTARRRSATCNGAGQNGAGIVKKRKAYRRAPLDCSISTTRAAVAGHSLLMMCCAICSETCRAEPPAWTVCRSFIVRAVAREFTAAFASFINLSVFMWDSNGASLRWKGSYPKKKTLAGGEPEGDTKNCVA